MKKKAIIISVKGLKLTGKEKKIFKTYSPWGVILFKRNIKTIKQAQNLITNIRKLSKDKKLPVLIDEEGISVTRLNNLFIHKFSQKLIGDIYNINSKLCFNIYKNYINDVVSVLKKIGVNINTVPVLDVLRKNTSKVIGNRSFSDDPKLVRKLGNFCIKQYLNNKMGTVIKHIPGHGCANLDSHFKMPKVNLSFSKLKDIDFLPFKQSSSFFAMTAHILYKKLDNKNVATLSKKIISKIIRKKIGFKGILISDDISMKALKKNIVFNATKSISSGCNIALYCSGNYKESEKLLKEVPYIDKFTAKKTSEFYKFLG